MSQYILALDQGTTSSRSLVFDHAGHIVALAQKEFTQHYPQPGWVEHDPEEILATQLATARDAVAQAGLTMADIAGIGITNQRETAVVWDRATGKAIHNAIVWQDRRTADYCDGLRRERRMPQTSDRRTGLEIDAYFSGTKVRWILDHVDGARYRAERGELAFGTIDSWLIWHLTGGTVHATDPSNASRTLLFNLHDLAWDPAMLDLLGVPAAMLPEVRPSSGDFGTATALSPDAPPIAGVAGDQQSALFGQQCTRPGMVKNTYGTGCFMLMNTGTKAVMSRHRLLTTVAWQIGGETHYALEGSIFMGGATVQWLRDELDMIGDSAEIEALAAAVPDSDGVVLVPAFAGLGTPHWNGHARGTLFGLTRGSGKGPPGQGSAGCHRPPNRGRCAGHGSRCRCRHPRIARRWRRDRQQPLNANPKRPIEHLCGPPRNHGNHRTGSGLPRWTRCGLLEQHRRHPVTMGG